MKQILWALSIIVLLAACKGKNIPDVKGIPVILSLQEFDNDFFNIDTSRVGTELDRLAAKYPDFLPVYIVSVLGINPQDPMMPEAVKAFINSYKGVHHLGNEVFAKNKNSLFENLKLAVQLFKHYEPNFIIDSPFVITKFVGPMDAFEPFSIGDYGDVRTKNGVGLSMQFHLGADAVVYEESAAHGLFYDYQSKRFLPEMMAVNSVKNLIEDTYPYTFGNRPLIEEIVEKGKRVYLTQQLLPYVNDSLILGFTGKQLDDSYKNEAYIWNYFIKSDLLYNNEGTIKQLYVKDGPKTAELSEDAPGYIGLFIGMQIIKAYIKENPIVSFRQLMEKPAADILSASKYKP